VLLQNTMTPLCRNRVKQVVNPEKRVAANRKILLLTHRLLPSYLRRFLGPSLTTVYARPELLCGGPR
jgi:hypothetical protein